MKTSGRRDGDRIAAGFRGRGRRDPAWSALSAVLLALWAGTALASVDVRIEIINGTTRQKGRADEVLLREFRLGGAVLAEEAEVAGMVVLESLDLRDGTDYLLTARVDGVDYHLRRKGSELAAGPVTLHVFDTTSDLAGVRTSGMNVVVRRGERDLGLEYLLTVENAGRPPRAVVPDPATLELALPAEFSLRSAQLMSGPEPVDLELAAGAGGRRGLAVALPPGTVRVRLTGTVPFAGTAELPVGLNVPVERWSLLAFPPDLDVRGPEIEPDPAQDPDYARLIGPSLEADETILLVVSGGTPPEVEERIFTTAGDSALASEMAGDRGGTGGSMTWLLIPVAVALVALLFWLRGRRSV
jgi:hypothetical protein